MLVIILHVLFHSVPFDAGGTVSMERQVWPRHFCEHYQSYESNQRS